jgi:hypothetical protein
MTCHVSNCSSLPLLSLHRLLQAAEAGEEVPHASALYSGMLRAPDFRPVFMMLMLLMQHCAAVHFREQLEQLQEAEALPTCYDDSPPLRTWRFPVASGGRAQ